MRRWPVLFASCLVILAGCIKTSVQPLDDTVRQARSPESVEVLHERPDPPYTVIAIIESRTVTVFESFEDLRGEMVVEAANLGGGPPGLGRESDRRFRMTVDPHHPVRTFVLVPERDLGHAIAAGVPTRSCCA